MNSIVLFEAEAYDMLLLHVERLTKAVQKLTNKVIPENLE